MPAIYFRWSWPVAAGGIHLREAHFACCPREEIRGLDCGVTMMDSTRLLLQLSVTLTTSKTPMIPLGMIHIGRARDPLADSADDPALQARRQMLRDLTEHDVDTDVTWTLDAGGEVWHRTEGRPMRKEDPTRGDSL